MVDTLPHSDGFVRKQKQSFQLKSKSEIKTELSLGMIFVLRKSLNLNTCIYFGVF